jgi:hypothetical protein
MDKIDATIDTMKAKLQDMGQGVAGDILNMEPTIKNVFKAQQEITRLKALRDELASQGINDDILGGAIAQAEENLGQLSTRTAEVKIEMDGLKAAMYSVQNVPFAVLATVLTDIWKSVAGAGADFNQKWNGMPAVIAKTAAVVGALVVAIGLAHVKMTALGASTTYFTALLKSSLIYQGLTGAVPALTAIAAKIWAAAAATSAWIAAQKGLTLATASTSIMGVLSSALAGITAAAAGIWGWVTAQWSLNAAMAANPILGPLMVILAVITAITAGVFYLISCWRDESAATCGSIKDFRQNLVR